MAFTCPRCGRTSQHPDDEREGYCGACHDWTGRVPANETSAKLAAALREIRGGIPAEMITRAEAGYYHDFLSPLAFPEMQLVADLRALLGRPGASNAAIKALADRVIGGDFDATAEESQAWADSPEGRETFRKLVTGE